MNQAKEEMIFSSLHKADRNSGSKRRGQADNALKHGLSIPLTADDLTDEQQQVIEILQEQGLNSVQAMSLTIKIVEYERNMTFVLRGFLLLNDWDAHADRVRQHLENECQHRSRLQSNIDRSRSYLVGRKKALQDHQDRVPLAQFFLKTLQAEKRRFMRQSVTQIKQQEQSVIGLNRYFRRAALQMVKSIAIALEA